MKVLLDAMNVVFVSFYATKSELFKQGIIEFKEENVPFFFHFLFNKIHTYFSDFGKLDICWDGKNSLEWRRSIFPEYKRNRDKRKEDPSYKTLISIIPKIQEGLKLYPCRQIEVEKAEADDVIFALSEKYSDEDVLIISGDGDLVQIMDFFGDNIEQYHPIKRKYLEPVEYLIEKKAIIGDVSDNIPGLFRIGPKTFDKMKASQSLWNQIMSKANNRSIFESFKRIVDLRDFPFKQDILEKEKDILYNNFVPDQIELFFWENRLKDLLMRWPKIKNSITSKL